MNHQEIFTISLNGIAVLFFGFLAICSYETTKSIKSIIRVMKPNATPSPIMGAEITFISDETKEKITIEEVFTKIAQSIRGLSWGSSFGFIVSLGVLSAQIYYICLPS